MTYYFIVDCDERGEFAAHVEDWDQINLAVWTKEDCAEAGGFPPVVDGFMRNIDDMEGLADVVWPGRIIRPRIRKGR